jgi:2-polyprenyl-3-methyl-5-hydroxy-6-metoxy-1,4-benzoquinol methylase
MASDKMTGLTSPIASSYLYRSEEASHTNAYLWKPVLRELLRKQAQRVFDIGCGNGALARFLASHHIDVSGIDPSVSGISIAQQSSPNLRLEVGSAYDDLRGRFGTYPAVVSLEVVEHLYYPRQFAECVANLLEPNGIALISTPYHGYLKNIALALGGRMDSHFSALWDHGHIKFWSVRTLTQLLSEAGLEVEHVYRVGRFAPFAKSMLAIASKRIQ